MLLRTSPPKNKGKAKIHTDKAAASNPVRRSNRRRSSNNYNLSSITNLSGSNRTLKMDIKIEQKNEVEEKRMKTSVDDAEEKDGRREKDGRNEMKMAKKEAMNDSGISSGGEEASSIGEEGKVEEESSWPSPEEEKEAVADVNDGETRHWRKKKVERKASNSGRIMVSIGSGPPPALSSTILVSHPVTIAGLTWRLQILFSRNPLTGQSRFLSLYVFCEHLPAGEWLQALVNFRLISQIEGSTGYETEIIAKFNGLHRHAGISNFYNYTQIFAEGSEFVCEQLGNAAQIEARIRVKSRGREQTSTIFRLLHQVAPYSGGKFNEMAAIGQENQQDEEGRAKMMAEPLMGSNGPTGGRKLLAQSGLELEEEEGEGKEDGLDAAASEQKPANEENNEENDAADEGVENSMEICGKFDDDVGVKMEMMVWEEETAKKGGKQQKEARRGGARITDFFSSRRRRSCRVPTKHLDSLRLELLINQVSWAVNEDLLEIFYSPVKGRGLRTKRHFRKDEFVVEYKGEVLTMKRAKRREMVYARKPDIGCYMFYFTHNDKKWCIDATRETADKGRLVNHSRLAPNMKAKVFDLGEKYPNLCLVALREIQAGEELTFDYGDRTPLIVGKHPWLLNT